MGDSSSYETEATESPQEKSGNKDRAESDANKKRGNGNSKEDAKHDTKQDQDDHQEGRGKDRDKERWTVVGAANDSRGHGREDGHHDDRGRERERGDRDRRRDRDHDRDRDRRGRDKEDVRDRGEQGHGGSAKNAGKKRPPNEEEPPPPPPPPPEDQGVNCEICGKWVRGDNDSLLMHQQMSTRCAARRGEQARQQCWYCQKWVAKGPWSLEQHYADGCRAHRRNPARSKSRSPMRQRHDEEEEKKKEVRLNPGPAATMVESTLSTSSRSSRGQHRWGGQDGFPDGWSESRSGYRGAAQPDTMLPWRHNNYQQFNFHVQQQQPPQPPQPRNQPNQIQHLANMFDSLAGMLHNAGAGHK